MTTREAARILGIKDARVRQLIYSGQLKATKYGNYHLIDAGDLEAVRNRPKRGRPVKSKDGIEST